MNRPFRRLRRLPWFTLAALFVLFVGWVFIPQSTLGNYSQKGQALYFLVTLRADTQTDLEWLFWTMLATGALLYFAGWSFQTARFRGRSGLRPAVLSLGEVLFLWVVIPALALGGKNRFPVTILESVPGALNWFQIMLLITAAILVLSGVRSRVASEKRNRPLRLLQLAHDHLDGGLALYNRRTLQPYWINLAGEKLFIRDGQLQGEISQLVKRATDTQHVASQSLFVDENLRINVQAIPIAHSLAIGLVARPVYNEATRNNFYERFMRRIVHDMRNPLAAIIAHANNLYAAPGTDPSAESVRETALVIEKEAQRLTRLVDSILFDARLAYVPLNVEALDLVDVIEDVVFQYDESALRMGKSVTVEMPPTPTTIQADRDLLSRALSNLLDNSLKYSRPASTVRVILETAEAYCNIKVIDTGEGIPQEFLPNRIFEPLVRAHPKVDGSGSGLGLSIVRKIAELHGGSITAESKPGSGTTMTLCLPR